MPHLVQVPRPSHRADIHVAIARGSLWSGFPLVPPVLLRYTRSFPSGEKLGVALDGNDVNRLRLMGVNVDGKSEIVGRFR